MSLFSTARHSFISAAKGLFGSKKSEASKTESITPPAPSGAYQIFQSGGIGVNRLSQSNAEKSLVDSYLLLQKYLAMEQVHSADDAIDEVINEMFHFNGVDNPISLNLDDLEAPDKIKELIQQEWDNVLNLLSFKRNGYHLARKWYVTGRLYLEKVIEPKNKKKGILKVNVIDPTHIVKIADIQVNPPQGNAPSTFEIVDEYYIYNPNGIFTGTTGHGVKMDKSRVCFVHSGIVGADGKTILSHLHKAIAPLANYTKVKDAAIIYRLARAPERRIFSIDVGELPPEQANEEVRALMANNKTSVQFNSLTGELETSLDVLNVLDDIWLPKGSDGRGVDVQQLRGAANLGEIEDIQFFQREFLKSLKVPPSRFEGDSLISFSRGAEISREENRFSKYISRLRQDFSPVFLDILGTNLILKGILKAYEWTEISGDIGFSYSTDNFFAEAKEFELTRNRLQIVRDAESYIGKYISHEAVRKDFLKQTDEEIAEEDSKMKKEESNPKYKKEDHNFR